MAETFDFLAPGKLIDGELELVLVETTNADPGKGRVPQYSFNMTLRPGGETVGSIRLRIGPESVLRHAGNIGYEVAERYRGRHLAARSCRLLLPLARSHGLDAAWLTVDPKNFASQKTCLNIGARYIETVRLPKTDDAYLEGDRYRRRYRLSLV
jgi:predicted acetyltransferase